MNFIALGEVLILRNVNTKKITQRLPPRAKLIIQKLASFFPTRLADRSIVLDVDAPRIVSKFLLVPRLEIAKEDA